MVVLGVGSFLYRYFTGSTNTLQEATQNQNNSEDSENNQTWQQSSQPGSGKTTDITSLASRGAVKCDLGVVIASQQITDYKGTFYSNGSGSYRMELWPASNPSVKQYTLVSPTALLTWSSNSSTGFRMSPSVANPNTAINQGSSPQPYDYSCVSWNVDSTLLQAPAGVTFSNAPGATQ